MKKVLVIEDDSFTAETYADKLQAVGYAVEMVSSVPAALARIETAPPDLIILDLMLGEASGVDVIKFVRERNALRSMPIIVLSDEVSGRLMRSAREAGANVCLHKQECSPFRLLRSIQEVALPPRPIWEVATDAPAVRHRETDAIGRRANDEVRRRVSGLFSRLSACARAWREAESEIPGPAFEAMFQTTKLLALDSLTPALGRAAPLVHSFASLLDELRIAPEKATTSCIETVRQACEQLTARPFPAEVYFGETGSPPLVITVDDDPVVRQLVAAVLERACVTSLLVDGPQLALDICAQNAAQLILLDIEMPGMNGFQLCERIHATKLNSRTPIVFVTARQDRETRLNFLRSGAADILGKPVMLNELAVKALIHLERGRQAAGE